VISVNPIKNAYKIAKQPEDMVGYSNNHSIKLEYYLTSDLNYWEVRLIELKKSNIEKIVMYEGNESSEYPTKIDEGKYLTFAILGDAPKKNIKYKVKVKWTDKDGKHEETIPLKSSHRNWSIKRLFS